MKTALAAGSLYAAAMFAAGFALGTVRVLLAEPALGPLVPTLAELPVMLALSWVACAQLVRRFDVPPRAAPRLAMGAAALGLLLAAETGLGVIGFGRSLCAQLARYAEPAPMLGLLAQLAFALFPLMQALRIPR